MSDFKIVRSYLSGGGHAADDPPNPESWICEFSRCANYAELVVGFGEQLVYKKQHTGDKDSYMPDGWKYETHETERVYYCCMSCVEKMEIRIGNLHPDETDEQLKVKVYGVVPQKQYAALEKQVPKDEK